MGLLARDHRSRRLIGTSSEIPGGLPGSAGTQPVFLPTARGSARLAEILKGVDQLNVIAINAQLAVARAGEEGQAFGVISGQLEQFSRETPRMIHQLHQEAVALIRLLVKMHQTEKAHARFENARAKGSGAEGKAESGYLEGALELDRERLRAVRQRAQEKLNGFRKLLGEVEGKLGAASHLALNARVEAAKITHYREQFASVANEVAETVNRTRAVIEEVHGEMAALDVRVDGGETRS